MSVVASKVVMELAEAADPQGAIIQALGDAAFETWGQNLTVATFIRPIKTKGGIFRPTENVKEDEFQGNVGLIVKVGDGFDESEARELLHTWVRFGYNDGLRWRYNEVPLRDIHVDRLRGSVSYPDKVL